MAKYKVGDKVRIVSERPASPRFVDSMVQYLGKTLTVSKVEEETLGAIYRFKEATYPVDTMPIAAILCPNTHGMWTFEEGWISGLAEQKKPTDENLSVTIRFCGRMTVAELYKNGRVVKVENARCNPKDTYDRGEGAKVAVNRLFEKKQEDVEETVNPAKKWKTGDKAVVVRQNGRPHHWYRIPAVVEVVQVDLSDNTCRCRKLDDYEHVQWVRMDCLEPYKEAKK